MKNNLQAITACAFLHKDGKLFVAKRAETKKFLPGVWELPGGHIEYGEDIKVGLKREIKEEFGIEVLVGEVIYAFTYLNKSKGTHSVEVDYLVEILDDNQKVKLNEVDHSEYRFVDLQEALTLWPDGDEEKNAVIKGFEMLNKTKSVKPGVDYPGVGVGAMIFNDKNELFILKRGKKAKNESGYWQVPGGSVELGDTLENAIRREVLEEFGIEIIIEKQMPAQNHLIPFDKQHWVPTSFICKIKPGQIPRILEPDKCEEMGWFRLDALPKPLSIITSIDIQEYLKSR